jgi:hypothetical protein
MRVISVFAGLLATSGMAWAEPCRVVHPAGTSEVRDARGLAREIFLSKHETRMMGLQL